MSYVKRKPTRTPSADHDPITLHGFALGGELRKAIMSAGFFQNGVAEMLGYSESRMSRLLSGKIPVAVEDVAGMMGACGIKDKRRDELLELARVESIDMLDACQQQDLMRGLQIDAGNLVDC